MQMTFMLPLMVLEVISNEVHVMQPNIFPQDLRFNGTTYFQILDMVVSPWIKWVTVYSNRSLLSIGINPSRNFHNHITPTFNLLVLRIWFPWITMLGVLLIGRPTSDYSTKGPLKVTVVNGAFHSFMKNTWYRHNHFQVVLKQRFGTIELLFFQTCVYISEIMYCNYLHCWSIVVTLMPYLRCFSFIRSNIRQSIFVGIQNQTFYLVYG